MTDTTLDGHLADLKKSGEDIYDDIRREGFRSGLTHMRLWHRCEHAKAWGSPEEQAVHEAAIACINGILSYEVRDLR